MRKIVLLGMVVFSLVACDNSAKVESGADSLKESLDTTLDRLGDSARAKGERTLEAIKNKVEEIGNKADSESKDSIH